MYEYDNNLHQLNNNWSWYFVSGILLTILGVLAIIYSFYSTIFSVIYFGILMIFCGIIESIHSFKLHKWHIALHLLLGLLLIFGGIFVISNPLINALSLTLIFSAFLIGTGIVKIIFPFFKKVPHKGLLFFNGLTSLILGLLLWKQWPISGLWAIGLLFGVNALITGLGWIFLSLKAKKYNFN